MLAGSSVWFGSTIRADHEVILIGEGTNVQENTVMHIDKGFPLTIFSLATLSFLQDAKNNMVANRIIYLVIMYFFNYLL